MEIRDTGFSKNQWYCYLAGKSGAVALYGSAPARNTTVAAQIEDYFSVLERMGYKPVWRAK